MVEVEEGSKPGVPAFMATFADLMTLLLVFFILLNVYSRQKQTGLLDAMTGSFRDAILPVMGRGGMMPGHDTQIERAEVERTYQHHDDEPGKEAKEKRSGDEIELRNSRAEALQGADEQDFAVPFSFAHGSAELPAKGKQFLQEMARKLHRGRGDFVVRITARASFVESMRPLDLAAERIRNVANYLERVGFAHKLESSARVVANESVAKRGEQATYRSLRLTLVRLH